MFDIGFWEICLVFLVALLVFGPEQLPQAARTAGFWIGKARRMVSGVQQEIERELRLQEMRDAMKLQEQNDLHQFLEETKTNLNELKQPLNELKPPLILPSTTTTSFTTTSLEGTKLSSINAPVPAIDLSSKS